MSERNIFEGIGGTVEFEIENTDALKESFNKIKEESLKIKKRFAEGTYTEDDLLNYLPRFGLGTKDKIEMYVVESKYFEDLANRYTNLKEIEKSHKEENGKLRVELDKLEKTLKQTQNSWFEDTQKLEQLKLNEKEREIIETYRKLIEETGRNDWIICNPKTMWSNYFVRKDKIKEKLELLKEILKAKEKDGNIYKQIPIEYLKGDIKQLEELLEEN